MSLPDPLKIAICVPNHRNWLAEFGMCLVQLVQYATLIPWQRQILEPLLCARSGTVLPQVRSLLVEDAIAAGAERILLLDDDMVFPIDLLHRLLDSGKGIVGINYMRKTLQLMPTARLEEDGHPGLGLNSAILRGLQEAAYVGTGALLLRTDVFRSLAKPWFAYEYGDAPGDILLPEDYYLCRRLREAGNKIWIDHDLSREVGHVGSLIFTPERVTTKLSWKHGSVAVSDATDTRGRSI